MPLQPKLACNSDTRTLCSTPKRCNSNDAVSTFEIHVGELHATFLRNHNMRRHKDPSRRQPKPSRRKTPKQKTPQARKTTQAEDNSSTEDPRNPDSRHNRHKHGGTAPVTWRCTRYVAVHPLRGAAPEQKRCIGGVWVFRTVCFERVVLSSLGCLSPHGPLSHQFRT